VSQGVKNDLVTSIKVPAEKIVVIHNPVGSAGRAVHSTSAIHNWSIDKNIPVVLAVGRLTKQKDFAMLIEAIETANQTMEMRLIILGEGEEREKLEMLVRERGLENVVAMPGFVEDVNAYYATASVLALSSIYEGFGNVLVEAMAFGVAIVSTDCQSGPREILNDGQLGELVPVGDSARMARAIIDTLRSQPDIEALVARARDFAPRKIADQYLSVLLG
jgi:glycosyltransferase involved in cell wall biosynthesis